MNSIRLSKPPAVFGGDKPGQSCYNGPTNLVKYVQGRWPRSVSPQAMAAQRLAVGDDFNEPPP